MATVQKNVCVSEAGEGKVGSPGSPISGEAIPDPADLQQAFSDLQQRFQRTTNALGSAAHDLKTPLAILNGYVELLQSEKLGPLNARQREVLSDMRSSGKRLQQFIQDFLTYSALETGGLKMQFEAGNINHCLSDVCRLWSMRFQEKGLALYFLPNEKLPVFPFDSPKLERVISNLLENSFKFIPQGGTVWLHAEPYMWERRAAAQPASAGERRRQDTAQPNSVKVSVSDTGPGIPAEFHQEVFDDSSACRAPKIRKAWGWASQLCVAWCTAWAGKSGWKAILARAANSHFSFPSSPPRIPLAKERIDEGNRQDSPGG